MTVTLTFHSEIEAGLLAKAEARGMELRDYLQSLVEQDVLGHNAVLAEPTKRQEAVRRMLEFGEKYRLTLGKPISRKVLHEGHRY